MGYTTYSGRYADTVELDFSPDGPVTADGKSRVFELGDRAVARLTLDVTAVSDSDGVTVTIECSSDGSTWYESDAFTEATTQVTEQKLFMLDRFVRADFVLEDAETEVEFTLKGEAV